MGGVQGAVVAVNLQRCLGPKNALEPGQYTRRCDGGRAAICCPCCALTSELSEPHTVNAQGVVTYAWKCPTANCAFLEFLTLESYGEEVAE